jgi:CRP-like cAMP-binding protein
MSLPLTRSSVQNRLLAALPPSDFILLAGLLEAVSLDFGDSLERSGEAIEAVYFPGPGAASVVASAADGRRMEIGVVGPEGMSGLAIVHGVGAASHDTVVQVPFRALRVRAEDLRALLSDSPSMRAHFLKFAQAFLAQVAQTALSGALYTIEQRLARWLLMRHDRVDREDIPLTHEFLSAMLGVRRAGITGALRSIERTGAIRARRGGITLRDRAGLAALAGAAYGASEAEHARILGLAPDMPNP